MLYYKYSDYLKNKYGEKVYKLPVNLPGHMSKPILTEMDVHSVPVQEPEFEAMIGCVFCHRTVDTDQTDDHEKIPCQQIYCIFSELYQYLSSSGQISQLSDGGYQDSGCRGDICFHKTGLCFG